jgi:MFS family permease
MKNKISVGAISDWETDAGLSDIATLPSFSTVSGVSVDDIVAESSQSHEHKWEGLPMRKFLPLIIGVTLAVASIAMGQINRAVAAYSGMTVIGSTMGYLWAALIMTWIYKDSWRKGFFMGFLTLFISYLIYYPSLILLYHFDIIPIALSPMHYLRSFVLYTVIAVFVSFFATSAVWLALTCKYKFMTYGIFVAAYLVMIIAIFWDNRLFHFGMNGFSIAIPLRELYDWQLARGFYELGFAFIVTTFLFVIGLRSVMTKSRVITK